MPFYEHDHRKLYFEEAGNGHVPLLLIPGLSTDYSCWAGCYGQWLTDYRLIMPDPRGAGRSEPGDKPFTLADIAEDCAVLLKRLGIARAHVLGHSMGGMIAQEFALAHPQAVESLTLAGTGAYFSGFARRVVLGWARVREKCGLEDFYSDVLTWMVTRSYFEDAGVVTRVLQYFNAYPYPQSDAGFLAQLRALDSFDFRPRLGMLSPRTLLIAGEEDLLFPPAQQRELAGQIDGAVLRLIPGMAHSPMLERGAEFARTVMAFLAGKAD